MWRHPDEDAHEDAGADAGAGSEFVLFLAGLLRPRPSWRIAS